MTWCEEYITNANRLSSVVGLLPGSAAETIAIVSNALGTDWLDRQLARPVSPWDSIKSDSRHPIASAVQTAGTSQVVEVAELAAYLKRLHDVDGLDACLASFRGSNYDSGLAQIAHAYRFLRAGAADLVLEPPVEGGRRGDLSFTFASERIVVECYSPDIEPDPTATLGLAPQIPRIFKSLSGRDCRIDVRPNVPITARTSKAIARSIAARSSDPLPVQILGEGFQVEIRGLEKEKTRWRAHDPHEIASVENHAAWVARENRMDAGSLQALQMEEQFEVATGIELVVHEIPGFTKGFDWQRETLARRIAKKAAQARDGRAAHRLLIVSFPRLAWTLGKEDPVTQGLASRVAGHLSNPCDLLLVDRRWGANRRYVCIGTLLSIGRLDSPVGEILEEMQTAELDRDPIADEGFGLAHWPRHRTYFGRPEGGPPSFPTY